MTVKSPEITDDHLALLARLLEKEGFADARTAAIPRRASDVTDLPLSFAQQRLWFLDRLQPGSAQYNLYGAYRFERALDLPVLARTLAEVERRHEVLRTTFGERAGKAVQQIAPPRAVVRPVPLGDLGALPPAGRAAELERLAGAEARRPFDLGAGPLWRNAVLRSDDGDVLLSSMHHIVSDGWSFGVLLREVAALYEAFAAGRPSPLPALPLQYADFALWQRGRLEGAELERQLGFWRQALAGAPQVLELPTDRPRPAIQSFRGGVEPLAIPAPTAAALRDLAREEGATLFMVLLAGLGAVLGRVSGRADLLLGSPIANRTRPEIEPLIGFFVNTLVLRVDLAGNPSFRELVRRAKATTLAAYDHQDLPFEKLVEEMKVERNLAHVPLVQVLFGLQTAEAPSEPSSVSNQPSDSSASDPSGRAAPLAVRNGTSKVDLLITLADLPRGLVGSAEYASDLFDGATVARLCGCLATFLGAAAGEPERPFGELPLLAPAESAAVVAPPARRPAAPFSLHRRFEARVAERPTAPAVTAGDETLTYAELDARANRLARLLVARGVGAETRVGLCLERTTDLPVAILAVLKAGGVYVPLDPSYPAERNAFVLADTAAPLVISRSGLLGALPADAATVLLDADAEAIAAQATGALDVAVDPAQAAYVIHTSGSTGRPKGVVVSHENVARLFTSTEHWFDFSADDVWTLFHSYAFDFSVWELWGALLYGGRLVVVPYLTSRSPEDFHALLAAEGVTVLNQTPSAFLQLARADLARGEAAAPLALRFVIFGGEALDLAALGPWFDRHGDERPALVNMYGITETTVHVTYRRVRRADAGARSLIGEPIPDLSIALLDAWGQPAPIGVPGEIHVGGAGLARGYLGRPELTAERFVPHRALTGAGLAAGVGPDGSPAGAGERWYRTGDLARRLVDGDIEYLGRIDHQVKIRGFRIELGEIEAVAKLHPALAEVLAVARGDKATPRIVTYFTHRGAAPSPIELRAHFAERLPDYMIPAAFVALDAFPLTAQGKIDRAQLPDPSAGPRAEAGVAYEAPRTLAEETLAAVWAQVLEVERVGIHDNFFVLGGDSIRSIQVLALARERGLTLSLPQLFQHQTIAELAAVSAVASEAGGDEGARTEAFELVPAADLRHLPPGLEDAYPLAMLQAGMLFHMALRPEDPPYHNVDSWQLAGRFEAAPFQRAVDDAVARHAVMRTAFRLTGFSQPLQLVYPSDQVQLPVVVTDVRGLDRAEQDRQIAELMASEKQRLFDFTVAPQLRLHVHVRADDRFQLTLTENHAIFDGWSLHSTLAEIFRRYFAYLRGENPAPEPALPLTFRDFIAAERRTLNSEATKAFWAAKLDGATFLELPRWPVEKAAGLRTRRFERPIDAETSQGLRAFARRSALPLKSVLMSAHYKVMSLLSGQTDVVSGLGFNGRSEALSGDQVRGLFLNTLPLRLAVRDETFAELARRTFEGEREILPHRRYPYNLLQQDNGGRPLFDIIFNFIHFYVVEREVGHEDIQVVGFSGAEGTSYLLQVATSPGTGERIHFALEYDAARLPVDEAEWIAGHFHRYYAALVADPEGPAATAALLAPAEREQLRAWSTPAPAPAVGSLIDLFERAVARDARAEALRLDGLSLTYGELDRRANQLARRLGRTGVVPGDLVGISLDRSLDLLVAIVGVLKAGAAYVPIDPTYPQERRALLLGDSKARVLISETELAAGLGGTGATRLLLDQVDERWGAIEEESAEPLPIAAGPEDLAYVIYTSGSTGKPKGVPVRHGEVARLLASTEAWYGFSPSDVWTLFHSYAFDFSVWEIWGALAYGGALVVVPYEVSRAPESFYRLLRDEGVTVLNQTPSAFGQLIAAERAVVEADGPAELALRFVIFGGEALELASLAPWFDRHGDEKPTLVNMYGITETTVHVTYRPIRRADVEAKRGSVIGRPIPDLAVHVLDAFGLPAPIGVPGEMHVAGAGLAVGYLGRPELTAERFLPDRALTGAGLAAGLDSDRALMGAGLRHEAGTVGGGRMYRSGDLARWLPDGDLEYLGRIDNQVKIRGFRIELAEIEAIAAAHPAVRRAVVLAREVAAGDKRLVAYVVLEDLSVTVDDLRDFFRSRLPEYMVPSAVVVLPDLPLTPHGKVDAKALPLPAGVREVTRRPFVAPRTALEETIAQVWAEVLKLEKVSVHDGFFDIGGNSLLAAQVFARLREVFGFEVPMRSLFEEPTIERLASVVEEISARGAADEAQKIERRRSEGAQDAKPEAAGEREQQVKARVADMSPEEIRRLLELKRAKKRGGGA